MENRLGMKAFIERIDNSTSKSIWEYMEEQIAISKTMPYVMGIPFGFEQNRLPELVINQNGVSTALQEVDRKDHFTDQMYLFPEAIIARDQWLSLYNLSLGIKQIKKR